MTRYVYPAMTFPPMLSDAQWEGLSDHEREVYMRWRRSSKAASSDVMFDRHQNEFRLSGR